MSSVHDTYTEPARCLAELGKYDVVVCGGGPAGCAAAIASARQGARTLLLERNGYLGGATVSQLVIVILSTNGADFQGIWHDYIRALQRRGGASTSLRHGQWHIDGMVDPEIVKFAWDDLLTEAGVDLLHHVYTCRAIVEDAAATGVIAETRAGRQAVRAKRVIDCTGDGIVAAQSGVPWDQGDGDHKYAMALTKVFRLGGMRWPENHPEPAAMTKLETDLTAAIEQGEYTTPTVCEKQRLLGYVARKDWTLGMRPEVLSVLSRVLKVDPLDPFDYTRAEREGRAQAWEAADAYRRFVPGGREAYLLDTSAQIGTRSSRRLRGRASVTDDDVIHFRKYDDGIARGSWAIDVWPADSYTNAAVDRTSDAAVERQRQLRECGEYYDIRYGCLVAQDISNLLMAGRCLSASHAAESSLRIQQTCMATGEAAGTAAAMSINADVPPHGLPVTDLTNALKKLRDVEPAYDSLRHVPLASSCT